MIVVAVAALAAAPPARAAAPPEFFGVSAVRPDAQDFSLMRKHGVGAFRLGLGWRGIQPTRRSEYRWGGPDQLFRAAIDNGLQVYPYLVGTPRFVNKGKKIVPPVRKRSHLREWQGFVAAAVRRYGPDGEFWDENPDLPAQPVRDWAIWNEPNAQTFWEPKANPGEFARLIRTSRRAIDSVDPSGRLVMGGIYGYPQSSKAIYAKPFLKRLYRKRGMARAIDGIAVHPYARNLKGVKKQLRDVRKVARRAGDRGVDLWVAEIGWASGGSKHFLTKTPAKQAKLLKRAYRFLLKRRRAWNIRSAMWFSWSDYRGDRICSWCPRAGLVDRKGRTKRSGRTFRSIARANR